MDLVDSKLDISSAAPPSLAIAAKVKRANSPSLMQVPCINLSPAEDKVLFVLNQLLAKNSESYNQQSPHYYLGNHEHGIVNLGETPLMTARMIVTPHEIYKTYYGRNDYSSSNSQFVFDTIIGLAKKNFPVTFTVQKTNSNTKTSVYDKVRIFNPLFEIALLNRNLSEQESGEVDNIIDGSIVEGRGCRFMFKFSPVFTHNIRERYIEYPENIHLRMAGSKAAGGDRFPQCVNLFRDLLFREKQAKRYDIFRDESTLIKVLGLAKEAKAGRKKRVVSYLQKGFDIFTELGLVTVDKMVGARGQTQYRFKINKYFK